MKITQLSTQAVVLPMAAPIQSALGGISKFGCILVRISTDEGVTGENLVFTLNNVRTGVLQEMVQSLFPLIEGRDPGHIGSFWSRAWKDVNFIGHKGVSVVGISAVDGALWDIAGKACGLPIYRLLGGHSAAVPAYHSGGMWLSSLIDELAREAQSFVAQGFSAMKMRLGSATMAEDVARVRAVREAVGPQVKLMADANQGMTVSSAIRLGRMLEEFQLTWFEEPLPAYDLEGVARVAAALDTPIASGETEYTRYGFRQMLELKSADILMPDLQRVGGVSEFVKVAHMAEAFDVPVSSHLFSETSLQVLGGLANANYLEYMPWFSALYNEPLQFDQGKALVPERPGWGVTFNWDYVKSLEPC